MSNKIGITMAGYIDENYKIMGRAELNKRIVGLQKQLEISSKVIEEIKWILINKDAERANGKALCRIDKYMQDGK